MNYKHLSPGGVQLLRFMRRAHRRMIAYSNETMFTLMDTLGVHHTEYATIFCLLILDDIEEAERYMPELAPLTPFGAEDRALLRSYDPDWKEE